MAGIARGTFIRAGDVTLHRLRDDAWDMALLAGWLADPRVLEWYEGRDQPFTLDTVRRAYHPRRLARHRVTACLILWQGQPVGYLQFYLHRAEDLEELDLIPRAGAYGIDLFIGVPALWGQGIGTRASRAVVDWLFRVRGAALITIDPRTANRRAIRSYEKVGFRPVRVLPAYEWHEGAAHDVLLMTLDL